VGACKVAMSTKGVGHDLDFWTPVLRVTQTRDALSRGPREALPFVTRLVNAADNYWAPLDGRYAAVVSQTPLKGCEEVSVNRPSMERGAKLRRVFLIALQGFCFPHYMLRRYFPRLACNLPISTILWTLSLLPVPMLIVKIASRYIRRYYEYSEVVGDDLISPRVKKLLDRHVFGAMGKIDSLQTRFVNWNDWVCPKEEEKNMAAVEKVVSGGRSSICIKVLHCAANSTTSWTQMIQLYILDENNWRAYVPDVSGNGGVAFPCISDGAISVDDSCQGDWVRLCALAQGEIVRNDRHGALTVSWQLAK